MQSHPTLGHPQQRVELGESMGFLANISLRHFLPTVPIGILQGVHIAKPLRRAQ
jgi:hypothetical protein